MKGVTSHDDPGLGRPRMQRHPSSLTAHQRCPGRAARAIAALAAALAGSALAVLPALAGAAAPVPLAQAPNFASLLYDTDANTTVIVSGLATNGSVLGPGVTPSRGALRQEPSGTNVLGQNAADNDYRIAKVAATALVGRTAAQMAAVIRNAINGGCTEVIGGVIHNFGCTSHLVTIDEVSPTFSNPATGGHGLTGRHFSQAMALLSRTPSRWGTNYAARVGIFVDAGVSVSIAVGHGRNHNLNARGRPQYAAFTDLMPGLARAGALWLEMYQGVHTGSGTAPFTAAEWRSLPTRFVGFLTGYGGSIAQVHFLFGNAGGATKSCPNSQACVWSMAALPGINRRVLAAGPGEYRLGNQAEAWLKQFNSYFQAPSNAALTRW
jgi:hypothetical protein